MRGHDTDFVEGLIFIISPRDLDSLRKYEKISEGYFVEKEIDINVEKLSMPAFEEQKTTRVAEEMAMYRAEVEAGKPLGSWKAGLTMGKSIKKSKCMFDAVFYAPFVLLLTRIKLRIV